MRTRNGRPRIGGRETAACAGARLGRELPESKAVDSETSESAAVEPAHSWPDGVVRRLVTRVDELAKAIEKMRIADYVALLENPKRLLILNFMGGLARGFGVAIGFTILGAIVVYLLQRALMLNLPVVGGFIAEIVRIVQGELVKPR